MKYVILKNITTQQRCFTTNYPNPERLANGMIAYEVLGYVNTIKEAQMFLYGKVYTTSDD